MECGFLRKSQRPQGQEHCPVRSQTRGYLIQWQWGAHAGGSQTQEQAETGWHCLKLERGDSNTPWSPSKSQSAEGRAGYHGQEGRPPEATGQILQSQLGPGRASAQHHWEGLQRPTRVHTAVQTHTAPLLLWHQRQTVVSTVHLANALSLLNSPHGDEASEMLPGGHPLFIPTVMEHLRRILCYPPPLSMSRDSATEAEWAEGCGGGGLTFAYSPISPFRQIAWQRYRWLGLRPDACSGADSADRLQD